MIYILSWKTKKHQKRLSRPLHLELNEGLAQEFKDFSRKSGIQGVFKTHVTILEAGLLAMRGYF